MALVLAEKASRDRKRWELEDLLIRIKTQGTGAKLFGMGQHLDPTARAHLRSIQDALSGLNEPVEVAGSKWASVAEATANLEARWSTIQRERRHLSAAISRAKDTEEKALRKRHREELAEQRIRLRAERAALDAALAARAKGTVRSDAAKLGKRLRRDHDCPYCGGPLGRSPHKDHIHPVSKGGLSIEANLVYVCQPCNTAKRGDTLNQFVDRLGWNHSEIRLRLKALGKDC